MFYLSGVRYANVTERLTELSHLHLFDYLVVSYVIHICLLIDTRRGKTAKINSLRLLAPGMIGNSDLTPPGISEPIACLSKYGYCNKDDVANENVMLMLCTF